jgi:fluoride exporter
MGSAWSVRTATSADDSCDTLEVAMRTWVAIALAGAVGVLARYAVQQVVPRTGGIPWDTFVVNVSGAFVFGFAFTTIVHRYDVAMWLQEAVLVGLLGGYTTFSTLTLETYLLFERGRWIAAATYSAGSVVTGIAALVLGIRLGRLA